MPSKHHSAATQAAGCQHLDSSEDVGWRKTSATASGGFNWPSGQKESSASAAKVDAWRVIKSEKHGQITVSAFLTVVAMQLDTRKPQNLPIKYSQVKQRSNGF